MAYENKSKQEEKKKGSKNFFFFLIFTILFIAIVQNFTSGKVAKIAFSYQLEPLVNLDLIVAEDSRKIALNDNLVTFRGRFKTKKTEEGIARFKFLDLLNINHNFIDEKNSLIKELNKLEENICQSAQLFLYLSGIDLPAGGYRVVDELYDVPDKRNSIVIKELPDRVGVNFIDIKNQLSALKENPEQKALDMFHRDFIELIRGFRSPKLGIGNEKIKQSLREILEALISVDNGSLHKSTIDKINVYEAQVIALSSIVEELGKMKNHSRLGQLRAVRDYSQALSEYDKILDDLEENQEKLENARDSVSNVIWYFNNKEISVRGLEAQDPEQFLHWFSTEKKEWDNFANNRGLTFKAPDQPMNIVLEKTFKSEEPSPNYLSYIFTILPVLLIGLLLYFVFFRQMKGISNSSMNFGKSPAKLMTKDSNRVTFEDVAGIEEAKEELLEIVEFLKSPSKFTALGGRIPKGVLCIGPPGTGKTLIAKAVAGEADCPFFSISGSDFVEMFVGVGASRIRDMFGQAKKNSPCIIFIDEIDAVGRHRGGGIGGGHDEREQTLNQLLVEMDGFGNNDGVILMAATNRPDVLDKALLRPGRFDRRIVIDLPDIKGRYEILKVHARKIKLDVSVDLMAVARSTPGASGADLMNLLNEAALLAARKGRGAVTAKDTIEACDKVRFGKERRSLEIDEKEKRSTAYHESGHAIIAFLVDNADPVEKVTIIPRGLSLGATHFQPKKNRVSYWKKEVLDQLAILMGGRVAEEIFLNDVSSGAQQDIKQATALARNMVCDWGMSEKLGQVAYTENGDDSQYLVYHSKNYSEPTANLIDNEVKKLIDDAYEKAMSLIQANKDKVELMTDMLVEFETLDNIDVKHILDNTWNADDKRERLLKADLLHKKEVLPPPPPLLPI